MEIQQKRLGAWQSLAVALRSRRTAAVCLLSFSSGLPLGLVWTAIPDWMRSVGVDIQAVGYLTLVQAPWSFKFLWAPFVDRYPLPFGGRRRGWMMLTQIALLICSLCLAGVGHHPDAPWIVGALALAIAFASASQDIAIDAYAVDVLRPEEQGVVVGARIAIYRAAMFAAGGLCITVAGHYSWPVANALLALLYLPILYLTFQAPEPEQQPVAPKNLVEAVWNPFKEVLSRKHALFIVGFVIFYKLADNLAGALLRPFLIDMGYSPDDRGIAVGVVALTATIIATFFGGVLTNVLGLARSLWIFGFFQTFATVGYIAVAHVGVVNRPLMYGAVALEMLATSLGSGAFAVFLLRMTSKKYAATQYAVLSALFTLPRIFSGPISAFMLKEFGCQGQRCSPLAWETFLWWTIPAGIPGLIFLYYFAPFGKKEIRAIDEAN